MIQDCQDKVFSAYKASKRARSCDSSPETLQGRDHSIEKIQTEMRQRTPDIVRAAFESAPLQVNHQINPRPGHTGDGSLRLDRQTREEKSFSDSAYGTYICDCSDSDVYGFCTCLFSDSSRSGDLAFGDRMY
jgi:hypothetical protein